MPLQTHPVGDVDDWYQAVRRQLARLEHLRRRRAVSHDKFCNRKHTRASTEGTGRGVYQHLLAGPCLLRVAALPGLVLVLSCGVRGTYRVSRTAFAFSRGWRQLLCQSSHRTALASNSRSTRCDRCGVQQQPPAAIKTPCGRLLPPRPPARLLARSSRMSHQHLFRALDVAAAGGPASCCCCSPRVRQACCQQQQRRHNANSLSPSDDHRCGDRHAYSFS